MRDATPSSIVAFAERAAPVEPAPAGYWRRALQLVRDDRASTLAAAFLLGLVLAALLAPWISPFDPNAQLDIVRAKLQAPSALHWFGTDQVSRDVLSRVLHGARATLLLAVCAVLLAAAVGTTYGAVAGFAGGRVDGVMMRIVDALLSIPRILLLLGVVATLGALTPVLLIGVLGLTSWFGVARMVRTEVRMIRERDWVAAARALGTRRRRILVRHVVPHAMAPVIVTTALGLGNIIVVEAGLAFLRQSVPGQVSWGDLLRDGREVIFSAWWMTVFPGLALVATVLAVNVVADRLRAALDPRQLPAP